MMKEVWKDVKGYEGLYQVSNMGRVKALNYHREHREKILTSSIKKGYYTIGLCKNGKQRTYFIHRLVAIAFVEGYEEELVVNHIDGDKLNNQYTNLEWCTISENTKHAFDKDLGGFKNTQVKASKLGAEKRKMKISVYKDGIYINTYESKQDCAKALNVNEKTIYNWLHKITKNTKGYTLVLKEGDADAQEE